jgi:hypothetical protein
MLGFRSHAIDQLEEASSALLTRVQRLEDEQPVCDLGSKSSSNFEYLTAHIAAAAQAAPAIGAAIERFAEAMRAPLPRGRAGGLARARNAWRHMDGTFVPEAECAAAMEQFELADYERYATRGRARARSAVRSKDGTFASS